MCVTAAAKSVSMLGSDDPLHEKLVVLSDRPLLPLPRVFTPIKSILYFLILPVLQADYVSLFVFQV